MERETSVSVFLEGGDEVTGDEYVLAVSKSAAGESRVEVEKESQQLPPDQRVLRWAEMRVDPDDLLYFYDVNSWHRRCVLVKALLVAGLGWEVVRNGEVLYDSVEGGQIPGDPVVQLLTRPNPNPMEGLDVILHRFCVDYFAIGNGYLEVSRDRAGRVAELYHVPGRTMRRRVTFDGYVQVRGVEKVQFRNFGDPEAGKNEILHVYLYDPRDDYYGLPDWYGAVGPMALDRTVLEFNTQLFANSMMAHMALVVEGGKLSQGARDAIKTFLLQRGTGVKNAGRVLLLEDERSDVKVRFEKLNVKMQDAMVLAAQQHFRDLIVSAHGVPPRILGIVTPGQLGASGEVEGQLRTFVETVLRPARRELETAFGVLLSEFGEGYAIRFKEMDATDLKSDADFFDKMIERGVFTAEEVRALVDKTITR